MWHSFSYSTFDPATAAIRVYRPILRLEIVAGQARFPCFGIVDTGADFCAFPMAFALALGLNPLSQTPTATVGAGGGGSAPTYHFDVILEIPNLGTFPVRAGFLESLNTAGFALLGHNGFLDNLRVLFDRKNLAFSIETP